MPKITRILSNKKLKIQKSDIYIDDTFCISVLDEIVFKCGLIENKEIDQNELIEILSENEKVLCFDKALFYVARKICSKYELEKNLEKKGFSKNAIESAVNKLIDYNYINDSEYVNSYMSFNTNKGKLKIKYELKQKGIKDDLITDGLEKLENQDAVCLEMAKKYISKRPDYKKQALYQYLISKGFEYGVIASALNKVGSSDSDE